MKAASLLVMRDDFLRSHGIDKAHEVIQGQGIRNLLVGIVNPLVQFELTISGESHPVVTSFTARIQPDYGCGCTS